MCTLAFASTMGCSMFVSDGSFYRRRCDLSEQ